MKVQAVQTTDSGAAAVAATAPENTEDFSSYLKTSSTLDR